MFFLGKKKTLESFFFWGNFSAFLKRILITVEAAKVLTMYGISHDASSTKGMVGTSTHTLTMVKKKHKLV